VKLYVASKFGNREAVRIVQRLLREAGHVVSYDWSSDDSEDVVGQSGCDEFTIPNDRAVARQLAIRDFDGIVGADAVIFLPTEIGGRGCYVESGIALALEIPVIVVGPYFNSIFMYAPGVVRVPSVASLFETENTIESLISFARMNRLFEASKVVLAEAALQFAMESAAQAAGNARDGLHRAVITFIQKKGMNEQVTIKVKAGVIYDLFADLTRTRELQRQAEDQAALAIAKAALLEASP